MDNQPRFPLKFHRRLWAIAPLVLAVIVTIFLGGFAGTLYHLGCFERVVPPQLGEPFYSIVERLGSPHFDSRLEGDSEDDFKAGYTINMGTRYHLTIKQGAVVEMTTSSR